MQGHVPGPPQPHFPEGLGPFVGYLATREPRPLDDRAPEEPAWADADGMPLDQFADVGDWQPMHRPLMQVLAVRVLLAPSVVFLAAVETLVMFLEISVLPLAASEALRAISLVVAGVGTVLEILLAAR